MAKTGWRKLWQIALGIRAAKRLFQSKEHCSLLGAGGLSFEPKYVSECFYFVQVYYEGHSKDSMKDIIYLEFQNSAHSDLSLRDIQKCLAILPKQDQKQVRVQERLVLSLYFLQTQVQKFQSGMIRWNTIKMRLMQWNKYGLTRSKVSNNWKEDLISQCRGFILFGNEDNSLKIVYLWLCFIDLWVIACH